MENGGNPWRREMKSFLWKFQCSKENSAQWITIFTLKHLCEGCCVENCWFTKLSCWGKRRTGICGNFSISKNKIPPILSIYCQKKCLFEHFLGTIYLQNIALSFFPVWWVWFFWVGSLTGKFSSPAAQQLLSLPLVHQNMEKWNIPASTGWHHWSSPGADLKPLCKMPFSPKSAFWGDAVDYIVGKRGFVWESRDTNKK